MATGTTYSDREFLFRLQTLIIDGGTEVIRNIFDNRLQNQPLHVVIATEKTIINRLRGQKTITKAQYDLLYPSSGQLPTSSAFDITLIVCLLRSLPSLGLNQMYNWNIPPQTGDTSVEADVSRLKGFRNEVAHISSTRGFQQSTYLAKWNDIEQVLLRLNSTSPNPLANLSRTIDSYKNSPMDPAAEQRIRTINEQWQEMERGLETKMLLIQQDVTDTKKELSNIEQVVKNIEQGVSDAKQDVKTMEQDARDTKKAVKVIEQGVIDTKQDVEEYVIYTRQGMKSMKEDVDTMAQHVEVIEKDIETIKKGMPTQEEKDYNYDKLKSNLQKDLISFYKSKHRSIPLSPLLDEAQPLLKFYVMPDIQSVKVSRSRDGDRQVKTSVETLHNVFYKENKLCSNIYLSADAGYGKTAFSKKLALAWCQAKKPDESEKEHFSEDEMSAMDVFSFVFVVLLRESSSECEMDMLILNQILSRLTDDYSLLNLRKILREETCLVILDGLDEWTHPLNSCRQGESNIPHQRVRENVAVLTTTRPWKLSLIGLHSNEIDQKLELEGLNDDSAKKLKRSVISHLHGDENERKIDKYETEFNMSIKESHKSDLAAIPLFLMYFLFLWYYKIKVGKSLTDLFSSFIELLLSRSVKKETKRGAVQGNIPPCFYEKELCKQFCTLLTTLGKLAFYTLLCEKKENTLVFDGCVAEKYLSKEELTFCLKTGIITQSKVPGDILLQQKTKVSFAHKTMQEFLAALYIDSVTDQKSLQETVLSKCKCVKDILDMSKLLMFIVSISAKFSFSRELMKIINEDEITQEYRRSLQGGRYHPLKDLQDMYISCCKEIPRENEVNLCLQDVFIDRSCQQEEYRENLKRLTTRNKQNINSVYINMGAMEDTPYNTGREVIDYFSLIDLENVEKIHYEGKYSDDVILPLFNSSVKSLYLSHWWLGILPRGSWSRSLCDKVTSLHKLEAIGIYRFNMKHSEWRLLMDFISRRDCLREIELRYLSCTDHGRPPCTGLDLSGLDSLRKLTLNRLELSAVIVNMSSLEKCELQWLSNPDLVLKFINNADNKLNTFICWWLQSSAAGDEIVRTLRHSRHITQIDLYWVTMEASVLGELVDSVLKLKQTVTVNIGRCTISPREEIETLKGKIKTSQCVRILEDGEDCFKFETKQDGC